MSEKDDKDKKEKPESPKIPERTPPKFQDDNIILEDKTPFIMGKKKF